jgi:hypothetical protein
MALYKCKLPLLDPLLKIYAVVTIETWPNWGLESDLKLLHEFDSYDPYAECITEVSKKTLPIEYQYKDIIGLKLREMKLCDWNKTYPSVELLVGKRKLVFLVDDLEKIA